MTLVFALAYCMMYLLCVTPSFLILFQIHCLRKHEDLSYRDICKLDECSFVVYIYWVALFVLFCIHFNCKILS